jgi:hypothetical protein
MAPIAHGYRPLSSPPITGCDHGHTNAFRRPAVPAIRSGQGEGATTNDSGIPVASDEQSLTAGPNGTTPFQDAYLVQKMQ